MSLQPQPAFATPEETRRVAYTAFPKGNLCLRIAEELGPRYRDDQFAALIPSQEHPAASPARLALASVLQYVEGLSDRQAADAVRGRIGWKYALGLELTDPGFDHTVLSEFRSRLFQREVQQMLGARAVRTLLVARNRESKDRGTFRARAISGRA